MKKPMSGNTIKSTLVVLCLVQTLFAELPVQTTRDMRLIHNLVMKADFNIENCHRLRVDQMEPNKLDTTYHAGNFAVDPENLLLTNEICPVEKIFDEDSCCNRAFPDEFGITAFSGDVGVYPDKKLLVNEINPVQLGLGEEENGSVKLVENDAPCAFTKFSGDIHVRDKRIIGQTDEIIFTPEVPHIVLRIVLKNSTSDTEDANLATGTAIRLKFFGVGKVSDGEDWSYFDVFFDMPIFAAQGVESDSGLCDDVTLKFGHTDKVMDVNVYLDAPAPGIIDVIIRPTSYDSYTLLELGGCFFYDICSKNIDYIEKVDEETEVPV